MPRNISTDWSLASSILDQAKVLHLALADESGPYCVPVNFARKGRSIYLHSGTSGKKLDMLASDPRVSFAAHTDLHLRTADMACKWSYGFRSVIGFGTAEIVKDETERRHGLEAIIAKWAGQAQPVNEKVFAEKTLILRIVVNEATVRIHD